MIFCLRLLFCLFMAVHKFSSDAKPMATPHHTEPTVPSSQASTCFFVTLFLYFVFFFLFINVVNYQSDASITNFVTVSSFHTFLIKNKQNIYISTNICPQRFQLISLLNTHNTNTPTKHQKPMIVLMLEDVPTFIQNKSINKWTKSFIMNFYQIFCRFKCFFFLLKTMIYIFTSRLTDQFKNKLLYVFASLPHAYVIISQNI